MRKFSVAVLCIMLVFCFLACNKTAPDTGEPEKPTVGFVIKIINPFFTTMLEGAQAKADELGIELLVGAAKEHTNTEEQIAIVQDMVTKGVKAICIAPIDSEALLPCLKDAQDAGVIIVNLDNRLNQNTAKTLGMQPFPFIGVSDEASAFLAAKAIAEKLGGSGEVAILEGVQSAENAQQRKAGAERAFREYSGINVVASQTANWNSEEALSVFTNILQANPNIKGVFCANDAMSFGVVQAIEAASKTGQIFVSSIDAEAAAIDNVQKGLALATVYLNQDTQAAEALEVVNDMMNGKQPASMDIVVETILYTKENLPN